MKKDAATLDRPSHRVGRGQLNVTRRVPSHFATDQGGTQVLEKFCEWGKVSIGRLEFAVLKVPTLVERPRWEDNGKTT